MKRQVVNKSCEYQHDQLRICTIPRAEDYSPSELTNRPLDDYIKYQAPFFSLFHELDGVKHGSVLEVGSGSGRALLDLKAKYPSIRAFGSNLKGYGFSQADGSEKSLWNVANHFNITVYCDHQDVPNFPVLFETGPIQSANFSTHFHPEKFDLIFSRHSFNQGKLTPNESYIIIPRILPLMKINSPAMIHMLGGTFHSSSDNKYYPILRVWNIISKDGKERRVSVVLYQTLCYSTIFCISVIFKKCAPSAPLHQAYRDCIIPPSISHRLPPPDWLVLELRRVAKVVKEGNVSAQKSAFKEESSYEYAQNYMASFVTALDRWEQMGAITDMNDVKS